MDGGVSENREFWTKAAAAVARMYGVVRINVSRATGYSVFGPYADLMRFGWGWVGWGGRGWGKEDKKKPDEVD